jgi:hypothetical protein
VLVDELARLLGRDAMLPGEVAHLIGFTFRHAAAVRLSYIALVARPDRSPSLPATRSASHDVPGR